MRRKVTKKNCDRQLLPATVITVRTIIAFAERERNGFRLYETGITKINGLILYCVRFALFLQQIYVVERIQ
jgi:hypothetical protein